MNPYPLPGTSNVISWYSYGTPNAYSSNFQGGLPSVSTLQGALTMFFTIDYQNFVSVTISFDLILNRSFFFFFVDFFRDCC